MVIIFFILLIMLLLINYFFVKNKILIDESVNYYDSHKKFVNIKKNTVPLSGGFFFLICLSFLVFFVDPILIFLFFLIYFVGLLSDSHLINSVKIRFFFQILVILALVLHSGISIKDIRIPSLNFFLNYQFISIIFTVFCFLILINGSNFIDGVNTLLSGYIALAIIFLMYVSYKNFLVFDKIFLQYFLIILLVFLIFNSLNLGFLGDSGAYLLSVFLGFNLLQFFLKNNEISPYFIVVLLWYPAFENLFSIFKRLFFKRKSYLPDSTHLHHKIFILLSKKINLKKNILSTITGFLINSYNLFIFSIASQNIYCTLYQIKIIFFNITLYLIFYYLLSTRIKNHKYAKIDENN
jgi:UDP-N-acetylmuramyl pentapeptide phosphotransferase/UDP-N-acetylglucosamine-1-phosphate transferase